MAVVSGSILTGAAARDQRRQVATAQLTPEDLRAALDTASIALTDVDGTILHWSHGCELLYGWSTAEAIGRNKYALLASTPNGSATAIVRFDAPGERELVERRKDGTSISVIERRQIIARRDHAPRVVLKMLDISDRVRAEAALRESEALLNTATTAQRMGVSDWDVPNGTLAWSAGSQERLGLPPGGINDFEAWQALVDPEDAATIMATVADASTRHEQFIDFQYRFRQADGTRRTIEGVASCFYGADGTLIRVVATNIDVTERVERELALQAREAQLRSVLDSAPSAMVVVDDRGVVLEFSPSAERLWGYTAAEMLGRSARPLMAPEEYRRFEGVIARQPPPGDPIPVRPPAAATAITRQGERVSIEVYYGHARTPSGYLITLFCHDVSERLAAERRLSELGAELAHLARQSAMSELAADMAHELNQPLSATANFLATARMLIDRGADGPRVAELLRMGEEQALRAGEIIRRLRDFLSRREAEKRVESIENMVLEAVDLVLFGAMQHDVRLTYDLAPRFDLVFADRIQIQQVLVNLLRNALEAMAPQPRETRAIVISSRLTDDDMVEIAVSDSGPGLPDALGEHFLARFATTKSDAGMGIGLSISRRIIEAHGGSLIVENSPGGGATCRFTLPTLVEADE